MFSPQSAAKVLMAFLVTPSISGQYVCNTDPISGSSLTIPEWNSNSDWTQLVNPVGSFKAVKITVTSNGSSGNVFHILNNWSHNSVASSTVDSGVVYVTIPSGLSGSLQFYVSHVVGSVYEANVKLCTGTSAPVMPPTTPPIQAPTLPPVHPPTPAPIVIVNPSPIAPPSPTSSSYTCNEIPKSGIYLSIETWDGSSGWNKLVDNANDTPPLCGIEVTVLQAGTTGNVFKLINNWSTPPISTVPMDSSTIVPIPTGTEGSLQYELQHSVGVVYNAEIRLCTCTSNPPPVTVPTPPSPIANPPSPVANPPPTVSGECSIDNYSHFTVPQPCLPAQMGVPLSDTFGDWRDMISGSIGTSSSGEDCLDMHDRYWVIADDGKAYHTWHPAKANTCAFGHEHGDDPKDSKIFEYAGGYPPFGFVAEQYPGRNEDHFGHKVVVASDITLAIGKPQDGTEVYKTNIQCQWLSKLHQGTYSADALTNNLHEYFLSVKCNDIQFGDNTAFSVKALFEWGVANKFDYEGGQPFDDVVNQVTSQLTNPWNGQPDPIPTNYATAPNALNTANHGGGRGIKEFSGVKDKRWDYPSNLFHAELWAGPSGGSIEIPGGSSVGGWNIAIAPYYIVLNPSRYIKQEGSNFVVKRTVDLCYNDQGSRIDGEFCKLVPPTNSDPDFYKSVDSPFKGTIRALHFKNLELRNEGGPTEFCTDVFGKNPTQAINSACGSGMILQKANSITNYWRSQSASSGNPCIKDVLGECHNMNLEGSIEKWVFGRNPSTGVWQADREIAEFIDGSKYMGAGIGREWIINYGNAEGVRVPN